MNMRSRLFFLPMAVAAALPLRASAQALDLYLAPDPGSFKVASILPGDARLGVPAPVRDAQLAAQGWQYATFRGVVTGYVPDAKIGKDLLPVDHALVHAGPDATSPVLKPYRSGDRIEIRDTGEWWQVLLETELTVYFRTSAPPLPPVTGTALEPTVQAGTPPAAHAAPPPAAEPPPAFVDRAATVAVAPDAISQPHEGVFRVARPRFGLIPPQLPYYLEGADGRRLAWIDTRQIVVPGSLEAFIDRPVVIHGERERLAESRDWVIRARTMRLK